MIIFEPIIGIKQQMNLLTSLLWINKYYKAAFTISRTDNKGLLEYYWYTLDHITSTKQERLFYIYGNVIVVDFEDKQYKIVELGINKRSSDTQAILQMQSIEDKPDYRNYLGTPIKRK